MLPILALITSGIGSILTDVVGEKVKALVLKQDVPENPGKGLLQSKTIWGGILLFAFPHLPIQEYVDMGEWAEMIGLLEQMVGFVLVWYGRKKASMVPLGASK